MKQIQIVKLGDFYIPNIRDLLCSLNNINYCNFSFVNEYIKIPEPEYKISNIIEEYSFTQLSEIIIKYREDNQVSKDVILICIMIRSIEKNYFSFADQINQTAIITIDGLKEFADKFSIESFLVSEIVEHTIALIENHDWHRETKGCIFDFCGDKRDIIESMTHNWLCDSCLRSLSQESQIFIQKSLTDLSKEINKMTEEPKRIIQTQKYYEILKGDVNEYNYFQNQSLAEESSEISKLLDQLHHDYSKNLTEEIVISSIRSKIQTNPKLKNRLTNALKSGAFEAFKAVFNHPFVSVPVETIRGFIEAEAE